MARNEVRVSSRRTLILLLAVGLGLVAVFFLYTYVNGIEDDVEDQYQLTNVLKAAESVPANTLGEVAIEESLVETGQIPREFRPEGAITNSDAIRGRVALFDIPPGLAITDGMFVSADCFLAANPKFQARDREAWLEHLQRNYSRAKAENFLKTWAKEDVYFTLERESEMLTDAGFAVDVTFRRDSFAVVVGTRN